jgi:hypothetical protein
MNQYRFDTKRTACPYCGSSDGFAHLLHPDNGKVVADGIGKCHSCNVFKTTTEAGYVSDAGDLVASRGVAEAKYFDAAIVKNFGLSYGAGSLVDYLCSLFGDAAAVEAKRMLVSGDKYGNTSFIYADILGRGMSIKTIAYNQVGKRSKDGIVLPSRNLDTAQIAGYITPEGNIRTVRVSDGSYQLLYGQHALRLPDKSDVVVVVESEKTALIGSIIDPKITWLASGGSKGLSISKIRALRSANAVPDELSAVLSSKDVVICFDYDDSGEEGSKLAKDTLLELGARTVNVLGMKDLLEKSESRFPIELRDKSDIADLAFWAQTQGAMYDDIQPLLSTIYESATGKVVLRSKLADKSLQKLVKDDYSKVPPEPSLTFSENNSSKVSQLAIPGNIVMLLASPGIGKSSIVSAVVARHLSPMANAFGLDVKAPKGILVLDTEQSKDQVVQLHKRLARRINSYAEDLPDILETRNVNWYITNKNQTVEQQVENLFTAVQVNDPSFVIVDQIGSLVKNVNSTDETHNLIKRIAVDAESNLRTWIVVLHTNPTSDKGRGVLGSDIHRWASSVLFIKRAANPGEPSLLTTHNADGTMAKVRAGAPVRCFFAWDDEHGDFYPTDRQVEETVDMNFVINAIEEIYNSKAVSQPLEMSVLRKQMQELYGQSQGNKIFNYVITKGLVKRVAKGKLWPDYEKLQAAMPS